MSLRVWTRCLLMQTFRRDTQHLALLIDERDEILENLEIAETRYISSFRLTTPDPSIADYEPQPPQDPNRPHISRPKALGGSKVCTNALLTQAFSNRRCRCHVNVLSTAPSPHPPSPLPRLLPLLNITNCVACTVSLGVDSPTPHIT